MENKMDYKPLYIFCKALEKALQWKSSHYFIPTMSVVPGKFPAYKTFKIDVVEVNTALGPEGTVQRFSAQQVVNSSNIIAVSELYQKTAYNVIENIIQRMLEHYGVTV